METNITNFFEQKEQPASTSLGQIMLKVDEDADDNINYTYNIIIPIQSIRIEGKKSNTIDSKLELLEETIKLVKRISEEQNYPLTKVNFFSNEIYLLNTLREWLSKWKGKEWNVKTEDGLVLHPHENLLVEIDKAVQGIKIKTIWIEGKVLNDLILHNTEEKKPLENKIKNHPQESRQSQNP